MRMFYMVVPLFIVCLYVCIFEYVVMYIYSFIFLYYLHAFAFLYIGVHIVYTYTYILYKYIFMYVYTGESGDIENVSRINGDMEKLGMAVDHRNLKCILKTYSKIGTYVCMNMHIYIHEFVCFHIYLYLKMNIIVDHRIV
jgi:hypothetical protein